MGWFLVVAAIALIFGMGAGMYMTDEIEAIEMMDEDFWEDYDKS